MASSISSTSTPTPSPSPTPTPTPSASSVIGSAAQALFTSLNSGSGVDTASLVTSLVQAQFATKTDQLKTQADALTAQISGVTTLKNTIATFASALKSLSTGGTLQTQPVSSNSSVLTASALPGAKLAGLTSSITVSQLASAQVATSTTAVASRSTVIGSGQLTLTLGSATYSADGTQMTGFTAGSGTPVTLNLTNASLDDVATAINGANAGVTASVVTDADGSAYLSLRGASGAQQAFTLQGTGDLSQFSVGQGATGTTISSGAQNAKLNVNGVSVERSSNTISDLIDGVKLQLTGTSTTPVSLSTTTPTDGLSQAVQDFVDSYNEVLNTLNQQIDPQNGPLKSDTAAQALLRNLRGLTTQTMLSNAAPGTPSTLAEIGITTNRDGTLSVNSDSLTYALTTYPSSVEAMFSYSTTSSDGITAAMQSISLNAGSTIYGLGASMTRYLQQQSDNSSAQDDLTTQSQDMTTRLTQQFASMNAKVAAYKSTQTFLKNQIDAWNNQGNS